MKSPTRKWLGPVLAAITATALLMALSGPVAAQSADRDPVQTAAGTGTGTGTDWLHTEGNRIVDKQGNRVWLTGANWFGFNATERVFHGLWSANLDTITRQMAERGINIIRVPISTQLLLEWKNGQAAVSSAVNTWANPELEGETTLGVFDAFLGVAEKYGVKVMLDVHSAEPDNSGHVHPVWWKGAITTEQFYSAWEWVTARYEANDTLVAMDVKNEPHGKQSDSPRAKWDGTTDQDNFGAKDHPVDLGAQQDQLVYSPHDYGPLVYRQPWFEGEWDRTTLERDVWDPNWLYLHKDGTAPLFIGEWGGHLDGGPNEKWMKALRDLMVENGIHHTFWCLNPNSGDTGGLLGHDWATWDEAKYALLKPALWQSGGKFVGLDHEVRLGGEGSTTGIGLGDLYGG
ncbi:glycoside hydrolase family 5 protein [Streptomyces sp. NPDC088746]|uniref:glycoside hydrolase family 5 protein n=1 Tax=Streptomyces sp. NPDC088746 TaxID=3365885 RepID=UPI00380E6D4D